MYSAKNDFLNTDQRSYGRWDQTNLKFDSNRTLLFIESTLSGPTMAPNKMVQLNGTETVAWVLNKFWVNPNNGPSGKPLGKAGTEGEAQVVITNKPGYVAYAWGGSGSDVLGYKHDPNYTVESVTSDREYVYSRTSYNPYPLVDSPGYGFSGVMGLWRWEKNKCS